MIYKRNRPSLVTRGMCNFYDAGPPPKSHRFKMEEALVDAVADITYVAPQRPGPVG